MTLEQRALTTPPEIRATDKGKVARGYAALYNVRADIGGMFGETIARGAFSDALDGADVRALIDHDSGRVIGRTKSGTLRLSDDDRGLVVEVDLPDTTDGRDLAIQIERGDISGMSFGFRVTADEWDDSGDMPERTIRGVELFEVSAVAFPAYEGTEIAMRSLEDARKDKKQDSHPAHRRISQKRAELEQKARRINHPAKPEVAR